MSGPVFTKKYSELYVAKFFGWYDATFKIQSNLSQKQQQTLKQILAGQHDFIVQDHGTYINTFSVGFVESPSYRGPSLIVLRKDIGFDRSIKALMAHSLPELLNEKVNFRGFEIRSGLPLSIRYLAVLEEKAVLSIKTYEHQNKNWVLVDTTKLKSTLPPGLTLPPFLKDYFQIDASENPESGTLAFHSTGFVDEKYLNLSAQKIIGEVRKHFNSEPGLIMFKDSKNFSFYYP